MLLYPNASLADSMLWPLRITVVAKECRAIFTLIFSILSCYAYFFMCWVMYRTKFACFLICSFDMNQNSSIHYIVFNFVLVEKNNAIRLLCICIIILYLL